MREKKKKIQWKSTGKIAVLNKMLRSTADNTEGAAVSTNVKTKF